MKHITPLMLALLCAMPAPNARAQDVQMFYQRERLILHPSEQAHPDYEKGVLLEVDVRKAGSHSEDWLQLTGYEPGTGLLEISQELAPLHIAPQKMLSPVDVIAFNEFGTVVTIAPNMVLNSLVRPIERGDIVKATLYTKAGLAEEIGLKVGDVVEHKLFKSLPMVVDTTTTEPKKVVHIEEAPPAPSETISNSNLNQSRGDSETKTAQEEQPSPTVLNRRAPAANPGAKPVVKEPTPLLDTILKRHHQPVAIE